jgi:PRC-barrel domain/Collagen triple helix repeat (20 copies)
MAKMLKTHNSKIGNVGERDVERLAATTDVLLPLKLRRGLQGKPGPRGLQGERGPQVPPGAKGDHGPQGLPGKPAEKGAPGPKGERGATGSQGKPGPRVPRGERGLAGAAGAKGEKGEPGLRSKRRLGGPPSPQGLKGARALQGLQGKTGSRGEPGEDGAPGRQGKPGARGPQGERGAVGTKGEPGLPGKTGGARGPQGAKGETGARGLHRERGAPGAKGEKGELGLQGKPGLAAPPGPLGAKGEVGASGPQGGRGRSDAPGPRGERGPQGDRGPGVTPDLIARLTKLEEFISSERGRTQFEAASTPSAAPRASTMTHFTDASSRAGTTRQTSSTADEDVAWRAAEKASHSANWTQAAVRITATKRTAANGSSHKWAYWALPLAALVGLGTYFLGDRSGTQLAETPPTIAGTDSVRVPTSQVAGNADVEHQTMAVIESLSDLLKNVKDRASATAALPGLQSAAKELDRLAELGSQLPQESRAMLVNVTRESRAKLHTALDQAAAIAGVGPLLQPTVDQVRGKVTAITMGLESGKPHFLAEAPANWVLISTFFNGDVRDRGGQRLGNVKEFLFDPDGNLAASIVLDRQLGFGEKEVAISLDTAQMVRKGDRRDFVIDAKKEDLQAAPAFEPRSGRLQPLR